MQGAALSFREAGERFVGDPFDHLLATSQGGAARRGEHEKVPSAVHNVAISHHLSELLEPVEEPDHVAPVHDDGVADLLLRELAELIQADEHLMGAQRQPFFSERGIQPGVRRSVQLSHGVRRPPQEPPGPRYPAISNRHGRNSTSIAGRINR